MNENLLERVSIGGILLKDLDINSFNDYREMNQGERDIYEAVDKVVPNNGFRKLSEIFGEEFSKNWFSKRASLIKEEQDRENSQVVYNGKKYNAIYHFDVLHSGWEMDNHAWIIDDEGKKRIIMTNHGTPYEADIEELKGYIRCYHSVIEKSQHAVDLLTGNS